MTTCDFCERWVTKTWAEHRNRLANMRDIPDAKTNPCPRCGGTYWAIQPPPGLPPEHPRAPPAEPRMDVNTVAKVIGLASAAILLAALFLLVMSYRAHAQTTFRDAGGRQIGTATRDANGTTTYRDGSGRMWHRLDQQQRHDHVPGRLRPHDRHGGAAAMNFYVLDSEHRVVNVSDDVRRWSEFFETLDNCRVNHTEVTDKVAVSTVFIGIDHRFDNRGPPLLFETMIFGGQFDQEAWRYSSWDDAEIGHQMAVKKVLTETGTAEPWR